jgi:hypothetical protein
MEQWISLSFYILFAFNWKRFPFKAKKYIFLIPINISILYNYTKFT